MPYNFNTGNTLTDTAAAAFYIPFKLLMLFFYIKIQRVKPRRTARSYYRAKNNLKILEKYNQN